MSQGTEPIFKNLTINDGLSDNTITSICQDKQGFMWIGTHDGLNRFDGKHFKHFFSSDKTGSLPNSKILKIKQLAGNKLGIITNEGFHVLNTLTYEAKNYIIPDSTALFIYLNRGWDISEIQGKGYFCATATGFYWFHYNGKILWRYDKYTLKDLGGSMMFGRRIDVLAEDKVLFYGSGNYDAYLLDVKEKKFIEGNLKTTALAYLPPALNKVWRTTATLHNRTYAAQTRIDTLFAFSPSERNITPYKLYIDSFEFGWPGHLYTGNDSTIILSCRTNGFYLLQVDKRNGSISKKGSKMLPKQICNAVYIDRQNRIWAGTENGIFIQQFNPPVIQQHIVPNPENMNSKAPTIHSIYIYDSILLLSGVNQFGIKQFSLKNFAYQKTIYPHPNPKTELNKIVFMSQKSKDTIWLGGLNALSWMNVSNGHAGIYQGKLSKENVGLFGNSFKDSHDNTWLLASSAAGVKMVKHHKNTDTFELIYFQKDPYFFPLKQVELITEDYQGDVWFAGKGLTRFNYATKQFDTLITSFAGHRKLEEKVLGLAADDIGNLWIATVQNGLLQYNIQQKKYKHYSTQDGLSSNFILSLRKKNDGNIIIVTRNKVNILDVRTKRITVYSQADGLPISSMTADFTYDSANQRYWAGYHDVVATIPVESIPLKENKPMLTVEYVSTKKRTLYFPSEMMKFNYDENNIILSLTALNYEMDEYHQIYYRHSANEPWRNNENRNILYMDNLAPGEHTIEIKLTSADGRWPDQIKMYSIHITPPFWKTWWFKSFIAILLSITALALYRKRIKTLEEKSNIDKVLSELEMKALRTQMNPHFTFNCLNSIKEMILKDEKDKASKYLSTFAQLLRDTLEQSAKHFVSLESTITHLERYISIEQLRFSNFTYNISVDPQLDTKEIHIPPMLLQPLVENAIWHGLQPLNREKVLKINFHKKGEFLHCTIDDNGIGILQSQIKDQPHLSVALDNITKRISLLNQKFLLAYTFYITDKSTIESCSESGTIATLIVPLYNED